MFPGPINPARFPPSVDPRHENVYDSRENACFLVPTAISLGGGGGSCNEDFRGTEEKNWGRKRVHRQGRKGELIGARDTHLWARPTFQLFWKNTSLRSGLGTTRLRGRREEKKKTSLVTGNSVSARDSAQLLDSRGERWQRSRSRKSQKVVGQPGSRNYVIFVDRSPVRIHTGLSLPTGFYKCFAGQIHIFGILTCRIV